MSEQTFDEIYFFLLKGAIRESFLLKDLVVVFFFLD